MAVRVLFFRGELDLSSHAGMQAQFDAVPTEEHIEVDLSEVTFMDSAAYTLIRRRPRTTIVNPSAVVRRLAGFISEIEKK